ncbi:hypothetical protein EOD39_13766 [Acipenser ruthenus]|uniref:PiggyBac transposable element-derived protein domain-containing protein n=1 Tax=Acipenser ruthenus TaxID=7906 RepID=A0A662YQ66_ACIRT|nr:hypothetical protein EOD39_13766 [Acipenser ruthenus]
MSCEAHEKAEYSCMWFRTGEMSCEAHEKAEYSCMWFRTGEMSCEAHEKAEYSCMWFRMGEMSCEAHEKAEYSCMSFRTGEMSCEAHEKAEYSLTGLGQGPSVVLGLAEQAEVPQGCKFTHDNLFTSLTLLEEMTKGGYGSSGTVCMMSLSDLMRIVAESVLHCFRTKPKGHGRRSSLTAGVIESARFDNTSYWPINSGNRFLRCRVCDCHTTYSCEKCNVPLHIECFKKLTAALA